MQKNAFKVNLTRSAEKASDANIAYLVDKY